MGSIRRDKRLSAALLAGGFIVLVALALRDGGWLSWLIVAFYAALVWWSWPGRRGRHVPFAQATSAAGPDDVIVYWRPG